MSIFNSSHAAKFHNLSEITRIMHPVGQGAFYSEHFLFNNEKSINVVYDCGAKDKWKYNLDLVVTYFSAYLRMVLDPVIDILFISHFDENHVNGLEKIVERCKINKVVLPVLRKDDEKWLAITEFGIQYYKNYEKVQRLLNNVEKVYVEPVDEDAILGHKDDNDNIFSNFEPEVYTLNSLPKTIKSGTRITVPIDNDILWIYIPIYFDNLLKVKAAVKSEIEKIKVDKYGRHLKVEDLENAKELSANVLAKVNNAYTKVVGGRNISSMLCYSGPAKNIIVRKHILSNLGYGLKHLNLQKMGCLYTGDARLKRNQCICINKLLGNNVSNIIILQLPHHGSKYNININSIHEFLGLKLSDIITFASFGKENRYKHPSNSVIDDIHTKRGEFYPVNENDCIEENIRI